MGIRSFRSGCWPTILVVVCGLVLTGCTFDPAGLPSSGDCGDGVVDTGEECDTADLGGQTCDSLGYGTGPLACTSRCTLDTSGCSNAPVCGDGIMDSGEECDDGNTYPCDGCSVSCDLEQCGNGVMECAEECDDGNTVDCDGCSASCTNETCGNGTIDCGEICETGNVPSSCVAEGYNSGTLGCNASCEGYDTSLCIRHDGQDCTSNAQCVGNSCFTEQEGFPSGYCSSVCVDNSWCTDGVCRDVPGGYRCYRTCTTTADCRTGYYCRIDPWEETSLVCRPLCTSSADCPITNICNMYTGRCNSVISTNAEDNGASCIAGAQCRGEACWLVPSEGYCVSECNVSNPSCPGDGVCSAIQGAGLGDLGWCLDGCQNNGDCTRSDYSCRTNPYGNDDVCLD